MPSCEPCNVGAFLDDEYFRLMVTLRHDMDHPDAVAALDVALRSLTRPRAQGLRPDLLRSTREVNLRTPAGLYTGVYRTEPERLCRVVCRITRGLFFHETGQRLPDGYQVNAYLPPDIRGPAGAAIEAFTSMAAELAGRAPHFVGKRVLSYRWNTAAEDPHASVWLLIFYWRVPFMAFTTPEGHRAGRR